MTKVAIVAIVYHEPEYEETRKCIEACNVPIVWMERNPVGVGSLAAAINSGFQIAKNHYNPEYVWFVTNVTFSDKMLPGLLLEIEQPCATRYAAIHPCFDSDHQHLRFYCKYPQSNHYVSSVPFIEFTAPIVRANIFEKFPLDEKMPYVGHDMAWGYDIRQAGYKIGVYHGAKLGHTYIRHSKSTHPMTKRRRFLRSQAVKPTIKQLIARYGRDYRDKIEYYNAL